MNLLKINFFILISGFFLCENQQGLMAQDHATSIRPVKIFAKNNPRRTFDSLFNNKPEYFADSFGFPVGVPDGKGYYIASPFWKKYQGEYHHLGEDWSGIGEGNSDLGDTIYAIANGYVAESHDFQSLWAGVVNIVHKVENKHSVFSDSSIVFDTCRAERGKYRYIESFYGHCLDLIVKKGQWVKRGDPIATIGTGGRFLAHLHLVLKPYAGSEIFDGGYALKPDGFINPDEFRKAYNQDSF